MFLVEVTTVAELVAKLKKQFRGCMDIMSQSMYSLRMAGCSLIILNVTVNNMALDDGDIASGPRKICLKCPVRVLFKHVTRFN